MSNIKFTFQKSLLFIKMKPISSLSVVASSLITILFLAKFLVSKWPKNIGQYFFEFLLNRRTVQNLLAAFIA